MLRGSRVLQTKFNDIFKACNSLFFVCFEQVHRKKNYIVNMFNILLMIIYKKRTNMRSDSPWLPLSIDILKWSVLTCLQIINQDLKELVVFSNIIEENSFVFFLVQQVIWNLMKLSSWLFKKLCFWVLTAAMFLQINELLN